MNDMNAAFKKSISAMGIKAGDHIGFDEQRINIRFEIGGQEDVYKHRLGLKRYSYTNPQYVNEAFKRAKTLYNFLPNHPDIMRIEIQKSKMRKTMKFLKKLGIGKYQQKVQSTQTIDGDVVFHLYWQVHKLPVDKLLKEIILSDIGGCNLLDSKVHFLDIENNVIYHLYDDRGCDIIAEKKEDIYKFYDKYYDWILEYDLKDINKIFNDNNQ
ncbi:DUF3885 domain-containing protein [Mollicutes bacterium LVI A0039]|nr:DUF3885 domain-containing protein [Mollicutes bacterium LVI A0039]